MLLTRRSLLLATAALPLVPRGAFAADRYRGVRVGFSIDGQPFGVVVTERPEGLLVTLRSLAGKFRAAGIIKPAALEGARELTLSGGGRKVKLGVDGKGDLRVSGGGVTLTSVEPVPPPAAPETQGFFGRLINAIGAALEGIAVGIAAGLAWLVGADFQYLGRRVSVWVNGDNGDIKMWVHNLGDGGVVPPPDDVDEDPTVWY